MRMRAECPCMLLFLACDLECRASRRHWRHRPLLPGASKRLHHAHHRIAKRGRYPASIIFGLYVAHTFSHLIGTQGGVAYKDVYGLQNAQGMRFRAAATTTVSSPVPSNGASSGSVQPQQVTTIIIAAAAGGGGLLLILAIIIAVVVLRRRSRKSAEALGAFKQFLLFHLRSDHACMNTFSHTVCTFHTCSCLLIFGCIISRSNIT